MKLQFWPIRKRTKTQLQLRETSTSMKWDQLTLQDSMQEILVLDTSKTKKEEDNKFPGHRSLQSLVHGNTRSLKDLQCLPHLFQSDQLSL